jgi:GT2 family glycosyltransferase
MAPFWLNELVGHALRPEIGAVGARLYYPDLRIQHAGVITGLGGVAGHAFKLFERSEPGTPQFRPHLTQSLSAVTAACLVVRRSVFLEVGGLDERELAVAFNDVDFCLRVATRGYRNVYAPAAELLHHESASRGNEDSPEKVRRFQAEIEVMKQRWGERLLQDPAYNPNLSLDSEDFALAYPPRVAPLVAISHPNPPPIPPA